MIKYNVYYVICEDCIQHLTNNNSLKTSTDRLRYIFNFRNYSLFFAYMKFVEINSGLMYSFKLIQLL